MPNSAPSPPPSRPAHRAESAAPASTGGDAPEPPTVHSGGEAGSSLRRRAMTAGMPGPGRRLGTFLLREAIGVGGMGAVFLAQDTALERPVALKILPPEHSDDSEVVQRFYQEARAAARLDHENIARVYTIGGDGAHHYIAFEYIEGTTIRARVERSGPIPAAETIDYALQIAGALVHAAERGVVHRDIKPSNIIVTPRGRVKLVDMGLARRFERQGDDGLTQSGMTLGTFDYISPEQARDPRDVDVRSDLYSLGCTLYHMLTGRPPFPEGTVLQKLLQHQEEPAPDVRSANPSVPAELAAILLKLMAKDRDRRHQTPEQLVRDLLTVAGALGLRSVSPGGLVWLGSNPPRTWERHLVWGVPTLALVLIVSGLVWWGQPTEPASVTFPIADPRPVEAPIVAGPAGPESRPARPEPRGLPDRAGASPASFSIKAGDDLGAAIDSAPSGSTIEIVESATFEIRPSSVPRALPRRDLTIRASKGVSAVLKPSRPAGGALLRFGSGRVAVEGLAFLVEGAEGDPIASAISAEGTDLVVSRCSFRLGPGRAGAGEAAALLLATAAEEAGSGNDRPAPVVVDRSFVGPGLIALVARGASDATWRDGLIGSNGTAFVVERPGTAPGSARLSLRHSSVIAGDRPVFRIAGPRAVVRVDDSIIAAPEDSEATLVSIDDPGRLDWLGRDNLYGRIGTYLASGDGTSGGPGEIRNFEAWSDGDGAVREVESVAGRLGIWKSRDPIALLEAPDPSAAFSRALSEGPRPAAGARYGPDGPVPGAGMLLAARESSARGRVQGDLAGPPSKKASGPPAEETPGPETEPMPMGPPGDDPVAAIEPPPSPKAPAPTPAPRNPSGNGPSEAPKPDGSNVAERSPREPSPIRTSEQFREAIRSQGSRGRRLVLASDATIDLSVAEFRGPGRWSIVAESGPTRPRIRFVPDPAEIRMPVGFTCLFRVRSGSLEIRGVDLLLAQADAPMGGRWGVFELWSGSDLGLIACTLTVEGDEPRSAAIAVESSDDEAENPGLAGGSAASIRVSESLIRVGGDVVDVGAGRRLDLAASDSDFASGGSLIHAHGLPKGQVPEPLKLNLRQVAARLGGGVANLRSDAGEPELPVLSVLVRDSILTTNDRGDPLIVVEGQGNVDDLRGKIEWEGHAVAYHEVGLYRRDQSVQTGSIPERYDSDAWTRALGTKESDTIRGDLRFLNPWKAGRAPWTALPEDFRLAPDSPAPAAGPVLKIPAPGRADGKTDETETPTP